METTQLLRRLTSPLPRPVYRLYAGIRVDLRPPRVFANSLPKAGTHLLTALLSALPQMMHSGRHVRLHEYPVRDGVGRSGTQPRPGGAGPIDWAAVAVDLAKVRNGQYATGHFPHSPDAARVLRDLGFGTLMLYRDPRDMAVSDVFYVLGKPEHPQHHRFAEVCRTDHARLLLSITGCPADQHGPAVPSAGERLRAYQPWLDDPSVHRCRFEDLVGLRGGGDGGRQLQQIHAIAAFLDRELSEEQAAQVAALAWQQKSRTFRKGAIGDWVNHFTDEHRAVFKQVAGAPVIALGYERDDGW